MNNRLRSNQVASTILTFVSLTLLIPYINHVEARVNFKELCNEDDDIHSGLQSGYIWDDSCDPYKATIQNDEAAVTTNRNNIKRMEGIFRPRTTVRILGLNGEKNKKNNINVRRRLLTLDELKRIPILCWRWLKNVWERCDPIGKIRSCFGGKEYCDEAGHHYTLFVDEQRGQRWLVRKVEKPNSQDGVEIEAHLINKQHNHIPPPVMPGMESPI